MNKLLCPSTEDLSAFSRGRLDEADLDRVAAHLERCVDCLETIAALDDSTDALLSGLRGAPRTASLELSEACQRAIARAAAFLDPPDSGAIPENPPHPASEDVK